MLSLGFLLEIRTSPWDTCLCSNLGCVNTSLLFLEVKKKQEKEGALPTKSRGCRDGGNKKTSGYQEMHAQITGFDNSSGLAMVSSSS